MQEHIRPVHECKLNEESSKKRDDFVDATTSSLLRLLQLPSVSSGSVASLLSSVQNTMLRLEEEDDKMLHLIESSDAGINLFVVSFTIACAIAISFQLSFCIGARVCAQILCVQNLCCITGCFVLFFLQTWSCTNGHLELVRYTISMLCFVSGV